MKNNLPIGIHWCNRKEKYIAQYTTDEGSKTYFCGEHNTIESAVKAYEIKKHVVNMMPKYYYS